MMQYRLKIRVWDKHEKSYWWQSTIEQNIHWLMNPEEYKDANYPPDCVEIEQCLGLKDKNGKLIYENDIVRCGNNGQFVYKVGFNKRFASFVLIRKEDAFNHYFGEAVEAEDVEVIGNIHENEDLLENK